MTSTVARELEQAISEAKKIDLRAPLPTADIESLIRDMQESCKALGSLGRAEAEWAEALDQWAAVAKLMERAMDPITGLDAKMSRMASSLYRKLG